MPNLKFSHPYQKLRHPLFTTVRRFTDKKWAWYWGLLGQSLSVQVQDVLVGRAVLCFVFRKNVVHMPEAFIDYDTDNGIYQLDPGMDAMLLILVWKNGRVPTNF